MQRGVRLRCLSWSVALTFCARLHIFLMLFGYFFNGAALGSPCLGLALGLPYELVCTLFQYFLVILASKASPMQRGARLVRSFIHFSTAFCLLRTPTVIDCRPPTLGASLSLCVRLYRKWKKGGNGERMEEITGGEGWRRGAKEKEIQEDGGKGNEERG